MALSQDEVLSQLDRHVMSLGFNGADDASSTRLVSWLESLEPEEKAFITFDRYKPLFTASQWENVIKNAFANSFENAIDVLIETGILTNPESRVNTSIDAEMRWVLIKQRNFTTNSVLDNKVVEKKNLIITLSPEELENKFISFYRSIYHFKADANTLLSWMDSLNADEKANLLPAIQKIKEDKFWSEVFNVAMGNNNIKIIDFLMDAGILKEGDWRYIPTTITSTAMLNMLVKNQVPLKVLLESSIRNKNLITFITLLQNKDILNDEVLIKLIISELHEPLRALLQQLDSPDVLFTQNSMQDELEKIKEAKTNINNAIAFKNALAKKCYDKDIMGLAGMIYTHPKTKNEIEKSFVPINKEGVVIHNSEGYLSDNDFSDNKKVKSESNPRHLLGEPLMLENLTLTPIGYNIHLPPHETPINSVIVEVYGGHQSIEIKSSANKPGELQPHHRHLLANGTVVVTLNLPDLLKLDVWQSNMSEDLHAEIHACINHFYQILKNNPESLHESLKELNLENKNIFLSGASFGGRTAVRQAELYPHTFDGYISHNGYLSYEMGAKSDIVDRPSTAQPWVDPSLPNEISKISEPVLILQSRDDNNVNAKMAFDFYNKLKKSHKAHLARVCVTEVGNEPKGASHNKGHFVPTEKEAFLRYVATISNFVQNGPSATSAISRWQVYRHDVLANKFYKSGTLNEKYIAEVLENARRNETNGALLKSFKSAEKSKSDEIWDKHYKPLYGAMYYVEKLVKDNGELDAEMNRLKNKGLPTQEMIKSALLWQSANFAKFFKEFYGLNLSQESITGNEDIIQLFKNKLDAITYSNNSSYKQFMLNSLYQANPQLLDPLMSQLEQDKQFITGLSEAKEGLQKSLGQQRKLIANAFKQSAHEMYKVNLKAVLKAIDTIQNNPKAEHNEEAQDLVKLTVGTTQNNDLVQNKINDTIVTLGNVSPMNESVVMNLVSLHLAAAVLSGDPQKIDKAKNVSIDALVKVKSPREDCSNVVEAHLKRLLSYKAPTAGGKRSKENAPASDTTQSKKPKQN